MVALALAPLLWTVRILLFFVRKIRRVALFFRVKRAKRKAADLNRKTGRRYYGVRHGYRVGVYDTTEVSRLNKRAYKPARRMVGPAKVEYRALTIFTIEPNGAIINK